MIAPSWCEKSHGRLLFVRSTRCTTKKYKAFRALDELTLLIKKHSWKINYIFSISYWRRGMWTHGYVLVYQRLPTPPLLQDVTSTELEPFECQITRRCGAVSFEPVVLVWFSKEELMRTMSLQGLWSLWSHLGYLISRSAHRSDSGICSPQSLTKSPRKKDNFKRKNCLPIIIIQGLC